MDVLSAPGREGAIGRIVKCRAQTIPRQGVECLSPMDSAAHSRPQDETLRILTALIESSDDAILAKDLAGHDPELESEGGTYLRVFGPGDCRPSGAGAHAAGQCRELTEPPGTHQPGERVERHDAVRVTKDGRLIDVSLDRVAHQGRHGDRHRRLAVARDITERNRDVEKLRESEARLRSIVDAAVDGIIVIDARGRIEAFNPGAERLFGYAAAEVIGKNVNMLMPSPYHEEHDGYLRRYLDTGVAKIIGIGREVTALRKDGTTFPVHLSVGELTIGGERKFTGILHDLSTRVQMEEQLREQAALVRLGEMAAVIAHEVKNPLAAVRGAIQVIGKRLPARAAARRRSSTDIIARIDTLNLLVNDLLLFARPPQPRPMAMDVSAVLAMTVSLLGEDDATANVVVEITGRGAADLRRRRAAEDRVHQPAHQQRAGDAGTRCHQGVGDLGRGREPDRRRRRRPRHSTRNPRQALHAVCHDEVARHRTGSVHGEAARRGASRSESTSSVRRAAARRSRSVCHWLPCLASFVRRIWRAS